MSLGSDEFPRREIALSVYRLYLLDAKNHIRKRLDLECRDDAHALEVVGEHALESAAELWLGSRLVKRFERPQI
jgi:hypothetical protein